MIPYKTMMVINLLIKVAFICGACFMAKQSHFKLAAFMVLGAIAGGYGTSAEVDKKVIEASKNE